MSQQHNEKDRADILDKLFGAPVQPDEPEQAPDRAPEPTDAPSPASAQEETPEKTRSNAAVTDTPEEAADDTTEPVVADEPEEGDTLEFDTPAESADTAADEEDDVKVYQAPEADEDRQTRVMPAAGTVAGAAPIVDEDDEAEENPEQIQWDDLDEKANAAEPAEAETAPDHDPKLKEEFRKNRESKVRSFHLARGFKLSGEEAEGDLEEAPGDDAESEEPEEEYLDDFTRYEDAEAVADELHYRRGRGWLSLFATVVWEFLLLLNVLVYSFGVYSSPLLYVIDSAALLVIMAAFNFPLLRDGWEDLRDNRYSGDTAILFSVTIALIHTLAQLAQMTTTTSGLLPVLAGFGLLVGAIGRQLSLSHICANFDFVKDPNSPKWAATRIEDEKTAVEIGRAAVALGLPDVVYYRPAPFLGRFLEHSYERPDSGSPLHVYAAVSSGVSLLVALAYGLVTQAWWQAFYLLALGLCLTAPVALALAPAAALWRATRRARRNGGMIVGMDAVQQFGDLHALVVDAGDLFPDNAVLLNGIKTFAGTRIDEAILDAAAVVIAAGGPLSHVFRRVIEDKVNILPEVDTLVYEQDMGLSGWVGGRRVLVGNRRLLENHGVDVPSTDYEMRYTKSGRKLVYLSTAGELSAMFVVTYTADETVVRTLQALNKEGVTLLVRTCDSNVTEELITSTLRLDSYYVEILHAAARLRYEQLIEEDPSQPDAVLASGEGIPGKAVALASCRRLRKGLRMSTVLTMFFALLGLGLFAFLMFRTH
ncbi:MAG: hypothetical protein IKI63_01890, partial [Clostridia bacterium]|nr:hypothetical protein [Clostridia bacterium]